MEYQKLVKKHYKQEAENNKLCLSCTMEDSNTRQLEIKNIISYLKNSTKFLEVGCCNDSASIEISKAKKLDLTCIDFSEDMIDLAKQQITKGIKGQIKFLEEDVLKLKYDNVFDVVFTERCIINLLNWDDQKDALKNMSGTLKVGGYLILLEAFNDGLEELNKSREELGLEANNPAYHNFYLNKDLVIEYLEKNNLKFIEENNFLSSYFFGSRVIYPALAKANKKDIKYNSSFVKFFSALPAFGNYSQIKILLFKKIKR
jgi:ubiquinone/menaquinone biosynthesis C-methylase UbiE